MVEQTVDQSALNEEARRRARKTAPLILRPRVHAALVAASVSAWITLTTLSLVPGHERPHTGFTGNQEHAFAYALAAGITRLCLFGVSSRAQLLGFSVASGFFEVCQIWIPGRSAGIDNWLASTIGALIGIVLARTIAHRSVLWSVGVKAPTT